MQLVMCMVSDIQKKSDNKLNDKVLASFAKCIIIRFVYDMSFPRLFSDLFLIIKNIGGKFLHLLGLIKPEKNGNNIFKFVMK